MPDCGMPGWVMAASSPVPVRNETAVHALPVAVGTVCGPAKRSRSMHLRDAEAIHHCDRHLEAALAAGGERRARKLEREIRAQRFVGDQPVLRTDGKRQREAPREAPPKRSAETT